MSRTKNWTRTRSPICTNQARRRLTLLIEANALTTMPDHQPIGCEAQLAAQLYSLHIPILIFTTCKCGTVMFPVVSVCSCLHLSGILLSFWEPRPWKFIFLPHRHISESSGQVRISRSSGQGKIPRSKKFCFGIAYQLMVRHSGVITGMFTDGVPLIEMQSCNQYIPQHDKTVICHTVDLHSSFSVNVSCARVKWRLKPASVAV